MTKKDFIALADMIRDTQPTYDSDGPTGTFIIPSDQANGRIQQWDFMVRKLADFCAAENPAFMRDHWLGYIAGTNGKNGGAK